MVEDRVTLSGEDKSVNFFHSETKDALNLATVTPSLYPQEGGCVSSPNIKGLSGQLSKVTKFHPLTTTSSWIRCGVVWLFTTGLLLSNHIGQLW